MHVYLSIYIEIYNVAVLWFQESWKVLQAISYNTICSVNRNISELTWMPRITFTNMESRSAEFTIMLPDLEYFHSFLNQTAYYLLSNRIVFECISVPFVSEILITIGRVQSS